MENQRPSRFGLTIAALLTLAGVVGVVASWGAYLTDTSIAESGPRSMALVSSKYIVFSADGDSDFVLEYEFGTQTGLNFQATRSVPRALWDQIAEGETIEVAYARSNPKRSFPIGAGVTSLKVTLFVSLVSAIIAVFGAAVLWALLFRAPKR